MTMITFESMERERSEQESNYSESKRSCLFFPLLPWSFNLSITDFFLFSTLSLTCILIATTIYALANVKVILTWLQF